MHKDLTPSPPRTPPQSALPTKSPTQDNSVPPLDKFTVPPGWTTNPPGGVFQKEWEGFDSHGQYIARVYGLSPGRPIIEDNDAYFTIFQSGDKF